MITSITSPLKMTYNLISNNVAIHQGLSLVGPSTWPSPLIQTYLLYLLAHIVLSGSTLWLNETHLLEVEARWESVYTSLEAATSTSTRLQESLSSVIMGLTKPWISEVIWQFQKPPGIPKAYCPYSDSTNARIGRTRI